MRRRQPRLLLVEDDERIARLWKSKLIKAGRTVVLAPSLAEARKRLKTARARASFFDVVLLDLVLPDGRGTDLLDALEAMQPGARVAVLSGYLDSTDMIELDWPLIVTPSSETP